MIKNGFVQDITNTWYELKTIRYFTVEEIKEGNSWIIVAMFKRGYKCSEDSDYIIIDKDFDNEMEANQHLCNMFKGEQ